MIIDKSITAVVTGGASGLGLATARLLASKGAKVAIFDFNEEQGIARASLSRTLGQMPRMLEGLV